MGTTSAASIFLLVANSLSFQEYLASKIGKALTQDTGFDVKFESAIVPVWRDGTIRLGNVSVVLNAETWTRWVVEKHAESGNIPAIDLNFTFVLF